MAVYTPVYGVLALGRHSWSMEELLSTHKDVNDAERARKVAEQDDRWTWVKVRLEGFEVNKGAD